MELPDRLVTGARARVGGEVPAVGNALMSLISSSRRAAVLTPMPGRHRGQDLGKRVVIEDLLDLRGDPLAVGEGALQGGGEPGQHALGGLSARHDDRLRVERGEQVVHELLAHAGCVPHRERQQPPSSGLAQPGRVVEPRSQDPLHGRLDLGEQAAEPVGQAGGLGGGRSWS